MKTEEEMPVPLIWKAKLLKTADSLPGMGVGGSPCLVHHHSISKN